MIVERQEDLFRLFKKTPNGTPEEKSVGKTTMTFDAPLRDCPPHSCDCQNRHGEDDSCEYSFIIFPEPHIILAVVVLIPGVLGSLI